MLTIVSTEGKLHWLTDASGNSVNGKWPAWDVSVDLKYELRPAPHQPLIIDVYGDQLFGSPQCTYKLILDNGLVLTGRASGGGTFHFGEPPRMRKIQMFDMEESLIQLYPEHAADAQEIDSAVFGVVSSHPLQNIGNGFASPSRPFTFTKKPDQLKAWSTEALRLRYCDLEITVVGTSNYWRRLVDNRALNHDSIVGVKRTNGGLLSWEELNELTQLLSNFLGWLNHCAAPVFHIKGYRKGRLVYRGYDLHPHATVQREIFSWFPWHGVKELDGQGLRRDVYAELLQDLFNGFAQVWEDNRANKGTFHIALQLLRGGDKGGPRSRASVTYLRDAFTACAILERILTGKSDESGRRDQIARCLKEVSVVDKLPGLDKENLDFAVRKHPELWYAKKNDRVVEDEKERATMSRPLANIENWLLHLDDPLNAQRLLGLETPVQQYMVQVSIWLADLLLMKVVRYNGWYFNRFSMQAERVPWAS